MNGIINSTGFFKISSLKINSINFNSTIAFLVQALGLKVKKFVAGKMNQTTVHLIVDSNVLNDPFELIVTDNVELANTTPIQFGIQSILCNLSDTIRVLESKGITVGRIDETNHSASTYQEFIFFDDPALSEFYLDTRPLVNMEEIEFLNSGRLSDHDTSTIDFLELFGIETAKKDGLFRVTAIDGFTFKRVSLDKYINFFASLDIFFDADSYDGDEFIRFDSNWKQFRFDKVASADTLYLRDTIIDIQVADFESMDVSEIFKIDSIRSLNKLYYNQGDQRSLTVSIEDQNKICWELWTAAITQLEIA